MDYFLWGTLKTIMYFRPVDTEDALKRRIQTGIDVLNNDDKMPQRVQFNFLKLINSCRHKNESNFEHLLIKFLLMINHLL